MLLTHAGFNQASTKFYIMEWILKYCMYWPDTLRKSPTDTRIFLFFFLSSVVCSSVFCSILFYDAFIYFCYQELSRKRVKAQVLLLHKIHVWHIDGRHITQEVQYKQLRETPHSDASKHPKHQQELFQPILQLLPPAATVHTATHFQGFGVKP